MAACIHCLSKVGSGPHVLTEGTSVAEFSHRDGMPVFSGVRGRSGATKRVLLTFIQ